jgi:hypothetical protein
MCYKRILAALSLANLILFFGAPRPSSILRGQESSTFFPLSEVHPGLKGIGKTVFQGNQVTEFQVEMLGIIKNVLAPKHDAILARLSGAGLEKTGLAAGMSGSPVYVDGKLVGAVAIAFPFAKEPYGVITPIEYILSVVPEPSRTSAARSGFNPPLGHYVAVGGGSADELRLIPDDPTPPVQQTEGSGLPLRLPLRFGGFDENLVRQYASDFRSLGFEPIEGGALMGSETAGDAARPQTVAPVADPQPGQMISLLFVHGDLNLAADCTVTYRRGNQLYACGHQVFLTGSTDIPFAPASVLATIPSLSASFKVDAPGAPVGGIHQDRFGAIYGVLGEQAATIPVHVRLGSTLNRTEDYRFDVAQVPLLSPLLVNLALASTVSATERMMGPSTLALEGKIRLSSGDTINLGDVFSGEAGAASAAGAAVATPLTYLFSSGFPGLRIDGIDLDFAVQDRNSTAKLEEAWASESEVKPGDAVEVNAVLRTPSGEAVTEKIPVQIPESVTGKMLSLVVGSSASINALEGRLAPLGLPPRDVHQMVRALNRIRRDNRLYALLMSPESSFRLEGQEFPAPPPSLLQTFIADPGAPGHITYSATSVVGDFETKPTPYSIEGQQMLLLRVVEAEQ